mmetsp:Transcript_10651/g.24938  ORF Transcript_10651/g.24938 Transcript_10651/m.24938 type:complete len:82 (+) Transcript_10651:1377-1622(+)
MIQAMAPLIASSPDECVTRGAVEALHNLFKMDTDGDMHCVQLSKEVGLDEHLEQLLVRDDLGKEAASIRKACRKVHAHRCP